MSDKRRVVVTGMGAVCPLGKTVNELWENLLEGRTSIRDVSQDYPWLQDYDVKIGSLFGKDEYKFPLERIGIDRKEERTMASLFVQYAIDSAHQAITDSGFLDYHPDEARDRTGVAVGVGIGGLIEIERQKTIESKKGIGKGLSAFFILSTIPDSAPGHITNHWHFHATESPSISSACASGSSALRFGYDNIVNGYADRMICGGTTESASSLLYSGFRALRAVSTNNSNPDKASRPFDKGRDGFVIGDGAGILVLEELRHAVKREAKIYGEILGFGVSSDGEHATEPNLEYVARAISDALAKSELNPEQIDYINCHGTSTLLNDPNESAAIKKVFGIHAYNPYCCANKSSFGHTTSAAGALETISTIMSIKTGVIPPTRNLENPDIEAGCDLNYTNKLRERRINYATKFAFGFFGHNVVFTIKNPDLIKL